MTVAVSGTAHTTSATGAISSISSPSHTVASGDNGLIVFVGSSATSPDLTSTVVWDSVGVNESLTEVDDGFADFFHCSSHYLVNPTAKTAVATATLVTSDSEVGIGVFNVTGLDTTTPVVGNDTNNATSGAGVTITVTGGAPGDLCVAGVWKWRQFISVDFPGTLIAKEEDVSPGVCMGIGSKPGASSVTIDFTGSGTGSNNYFVCGMMLQAAVGGALTVQTDHSYPYNIIAEVQADDDYRYNVAQVVQADDDYRYNIAQAVQRDRDYRYDVVSLGQVLRDRDYRYNIAEGMTPVQADHDYRYNILFGVQADHDYRYNIYLGAEADHDYRYNITGRPFVDRHYVYNIGDVPVGGTHFGMI